MVTPESLKTAIVGCGRQGHRLIRSVAQIDARSRPEIVALCDPWPLSCKSASLLCPGAREFQDLETLLDQSSEELDAVIVASPDYLHAEQALACLQRKLHAYIEPPMALTAGADGS
jgi:predicted dehydrogenase